jgi:adenosine deaminase
MKNILLCPLGKSPLIAVEAFLLAKNQIDEVHIFSNYHADYDKIIEYFLEKNIVFSITLLNNFLDIKNENDHFYYEEALLRWYLSYVDKNHQIVVCLAGGFKTISNSLQKASGLFGAIELFHLLTFSFPKEINEIQSMISDGQIIYVSMSVESGWAPIVFLLKDRFLNENEKKDNNIFFIEKPKELDLKTAIDSILEKTKSENTQNYSYELPFNSILMLPIHTQHWLKEKLTEQDCDWILSLPKTELHCHLGGFATHGGLLREVQNAANSLENSGFPSENEHPATWNEKIIPLEEYMKLGDANGSKLLKNDDCLKKQIELLYNELCKQNIKYAEIRCSPDNYHTDEQTTFEVLTNIKKYFQNEMDARKDMQDFCHVNLIVIVTRRREGDLSSISRHIALAITSSQISLKNIQNCCNVVGVDLAGYESRETRASYFMQDFVGVHRSGLAVTAHAGENDDAEGIWQAVYQLHARRLGHALHLYQAKDLINSVVARKIGVEMCPYANFQIKGFWPMKYEKINDKDQNENYPNYPLLDYLNAGVLVSVNTDNIGISAANLTENFILLTKLLPEITRMDVLKLLRNGVEMAFITPDFRNQLINVFEREIFKACKNITL